MSRSEYWESTRQARAEERLLEARDRGELDVGTVPDALKEVSDFTSDEGDARVVAQALGVLDACDVVGLLQDMGFALQDLSQRAVDDSEAWVADRLEALEVSPSVAVATVQELQEYRPSDLIEHAVALQALIWAVRSPDEDNIHGCGIGRI
jgi:hypothetical protein